MKQIAVKSGARDVIPGDEVYFQHPEHGVLAGRVSSAGGDGCMVKSGDDEHPVRWADLLGHKTRSQRRMVIVDKGEDGAIVEDEAGKRAFVRGPLPGGEADPGAAAGAPLSKADLLELGALLKGSQPDVGLLLEGMRAQVLELARAQAEQTSELTKAISALADEMKAMRQA